MVYKDSLIRHIAMRTFVSDNCLFSIKSRWRFPFELTVDIELIKTSFPRNRRKRAFFLSAGLL
jgi:hypothetical protein